MFLADLYLYVQSISRVKHPVFFLKLHTLLVICDAIRQCATYCGLCGKVVRDSGPHMYRAVKTFLCSTPCSNVKQRHGFPIFFKVFVQQPGCLCSCLYPHAYTLLRMLRVTNWANLGKCFVYYLRWNLLESDYFDISESFSFRQKIR